jgi:hypothetical protein
MISKLLNLLRRKDTGLYLFGVMRIPPSAAKNLCVIQLEQTKTSPIIHRDLAAVVVPLDLASFEVNPERLFWHSKVLEQLMKRGTILPLSFGTVARRKNEVKELLQNGYSVFHQSLEELAGKVEFDVEVHWDPKAVLKQISEESPEILQFKRELAAKGEGVSMQDQITAGRMVAAQMVKRARLLTEEIQGTLGKGALASASLKPSNKESSVTNLGFLVSQDRQEPFEKAIYALGDRYGDQLKFKYAGPFPPYSFTGLEIFPTDEEKLSNARDLLGVGQNFTVAELRQSYRRQSAQIHPDKHGGDPAAVESFKQFRQAYDLLMLYRESYPDSSSLPHLKGSTLFLVRRKQREAEGKAQENE